MGVWLMDRTASSPAGAAGGVAGAGGEARERGAGGVCVGNG